MTKLLISAYSNTFFQTKYTLKKNIEAINKFRKNGNLFMIATKLPPYLILEKINKYKIKYDYLSCLNGTVLYDKKANVLYKSTMSGCEIGDIMSLFARYNFTDQVYSLKIDNQTLYYAVKPNLSINFINLVLNVYQKKNINTLYQSGMLVFFSKACDKVSSVDFIANNYHIDKDNIYTIGSSINDYNMIKKYNGHNMLYESNIKLFSVSNKSYKAVHHLVNDILENKTKKRCIFK